MGLINMEPREFALHTGSTATGDGEIFALKSEFGGLSVQIIGITSATITFEGTVDGANWVAQRAVNKATGAVATTATADGIYLFDVVGIRKFRARISAYTSGTIMATANAVLIAPAGTNEIGSTQLTDGTKASQKLSVDANGKAAVKAADLESAIGTAVASPAANTLLARIKNLEDKLAAIIAGTSPAVVQLSGSNLAEAKVVNVTLPGTRQQLDDKPCHEVTIIAKRGNTGYIYVGKSTVSSTVYGAELGELDSITLEVSNTNEIYIDASVSGEGISYVAI